MVTLKPLFKAFLSVGETWNSRSKSSKNNTYPGNHSRNPSDFIELGDKESRRRPTESEEALALDDSDGIKESNFSVKVKKVFEVRHG